jgi:hypothetical protein
MSTLLVCVRLHSRRCGLCVCWSAPVYARAWSLRAVRVLVSDRALPYNPFMITGALVSCSLLGRAYAKKKDRLFTDSSSRFTHLLNGIQSMAGMLLLVAAIALLLLSSFQLAAVAASGVLLSSSLLVGATTGVAAASLANNASGCD